jgi:outer membrane receptor protein involved in Fe transport
MTAVPQASLINVTLNNGVIVSKNGTDGNVFYAPVASYDGRNTAGFVSDEWQVNDKIKVDFGMRHEQQKISGTISNLTSADTDNNPLTVYNNGTSMPDGSNTYLSRTDSANSFTIGGNYKLAKDTSVFVRANRGHTFISFDDLRGAGTQAAPTTATCCQRRKSASTKSASRLHHSCTPRISTPSTPHLTASPSRKCSPTARNCIRSAVRKATASNLKWRCARSRTCNCS